MRALGCAQDRLSEKRTFELLGIPTTRYAAVDSRESLDLAVASIGLPGVLKTRRMGYDGKGQLVLRSAADVKGAYEKLGSVPCILEGFVRFERELSLVKVRADRTLRGQVLETVELFRAKVIDVAPDTLTIEATGNPDKLDALLRDLEPYGIKEMVQSGLVAIGRGSRSITTGPALRAA